MLACSRPLDRPLQGAPPVHGEISSGLLVEPPPTLTVPGGAAPVPSPMVPVAPTPSPSPALAARAPILSGLAPAPDAQVPHGPVSIAARIAGSVELVEVALVLDGAAVQPKITPQDPRTWLVAYTDQLEVGKHAVQLNARDRDGRAGGYRWQFEVQTKQPPTPTAQPTAATPATMPPATPARQPAAPITPQPGPTRRPQDRS